MALYQKNRIKRFGEYVLNLRNRIKEFHIKPIDDNLYNESLNYLDEVIKNHEYIGYEEEELKYVYDTVLKKEYLNEEIVKHLLISICHNIATMKRVKTKLGSKLSKEQLEDYKFFCREWVNYQDTLYILDQIE